MITFKIKKFKQKNYSNFLIKNFEFKKQKLFNINPNRINRQKTIEVRTSNKQPHNDSISLEYRSNYYSKFL